MKTKIFNLVILDESGSMQSIAREAVDGVNETVQTIRTAQRNHEDQEHFVSLVTFNSNAVKTLHDGVSVMEIGELADGQYLPNGLTPLYDAMGQSLHALRSRVEAGDKVLVTIITDGEENASVEYDGRAVKALVDELKAEGWVFAYIGANQDAEKAAAAVSIANAMHFQASSEGTRAMMKYANARKGAFYDRISRGVWNAAEENNCFFDENI